MVILSNQDLYEVKISSLLAGYDRDTLANLYQPIIGYSALAIYFTFWSEGNNKFASLSTHEELLMRMQMPAGHFVDARKRLEAVGLLKTKLQKTEGSNVYHYELLSPKTPFNFFSDTILYGMLIQSIGEEEAAKTKKLYECSINEQSGEDISSSFNDVFHPDYENDSFLIAATETNKTIGRNKAKIATEFNYEVFFKELGKISSILDKDIYKKEMKEISRIAALFGVKEAEMAYVVERSYDPTKEKGKRVDLDQISNDLINESNYSFKKKGLRNQKGKVNNDSLLARKINLFETTAPKDILRLLQNGTKVAPSDLKIIETLSKEYKLNNGVINVVVDFVLETNQNILSRSFAEKMAASFNRENIETTVDAMNYCNSYLEKLSSKTKKTKKIENENKPEVKANTVVSAEQWNELFESEGENNDGKTDSELPF